MLARPPRPVAVADDLLASIAMLLRERIDDEPHPTQLQIFATDIDASALAEARRGQYPSAVERQVSPERLVRFFTKRGDSYSVTKSLRDLCIFTEHDLVKDPPFSRMDLVSCRNLLIYLEPASRSASSSSSTTRSDRAGTCSSARPR